MEYIVCWDVAATFVCMCPMCTLESWLIQKDYVCVSHGISTGFSRETSQKTRIFSFFTPRKILKKEGKNIKIEDVKLSWAVLVRVYVKACAARN